MNVAIPGLVAAAVTLAILFFWLRRGGGMPLDHANDRSLHVGAVPRIGGIAMTAGIAAALSLLSLPDSLAPIALATLALFAVSLIDDLRPLPVVPRLLGHLLAAGVAVWALEVPLVMALPAVVALAWMANLYNFMDGADGLAGGMTAIGFTAYALAAWVRMPELSMACVAIAGAALGFLAFNFPPARVFMGDAGSVPLGFLAGAFGLAGWRAGIWPGWFPVLVFSPFILDATVTLGRRLRQGVAIWHAHREHAYQRLILRGWSHRRLALTAWLLMTAAAGTALGLRDASAGGQLSGVLAWVLIYGAIFCWVGKRWRQAAKGS
jgi:UDP-N-acetylmuramyl pentapeptide phosphotransferase/UDP-N-acetylglucosamine-1-phosphate transferase